MLSFPISNGDYCIENVILAGFDTYFLKLYARNIEERCQEMHCRRSWWRDFSETCCNCQCLSFSNPNNESSIVIILQDHKALFGARMLSYSINGSLSHIHLPLFLSMLREISC